MNAVVLMATPCPKSLHGKGEKWIARNISQGLDSRQPTLDYPAESLFVMKADGLHWLRVNELELSVPLRPA